MENTGKLGALRATLVVFGIIFIVGIYPLTTLWPAGWAWHMGDPSMYLEMILGIYATLGVFLVLAARNPLAYLSLISFTVWSSLVHAGIMAAQSIAYPEHRGHLYGDVPALLLIAVVLAVLIRRGAKVPA
jgi:hypothetical protein